MKILITGAGGQLGQVLSQALASHEVHALLHAHLDITKLPAVRTVIETIEPHLIINTAAYNNVDGAEADPEAAYRGNALGPRNLALVSAAHGVPLLHVSTDYVFSGTGKRPYHEFDRTDPQSVYGESKLAGEQAVKELNARHFIVRTAWLYHIVGKNFPTTMIALARQQSAVRVVNDQRGSPTYVPHLVDALIMLCQTNAYGTYHLVGQGAATRYELTCRLYHQLNVETPVQPVATAEFPRAATRPAYSVLTTLQDPQLLLPPWEDGVVQFAAAIQRRSHS
ncbi:MAG: dTDP-4-dehydrorhamnose reductase [Deltaproteobacteria bacterium]|nr:dTDP-4-dehydrorhamnose reductase [Deltaproteobacteria bacterium]